MIIHCTKKITEKLPYVATTRLQEDCPLGSWHANVYQFKRRHCVLFCHDLSRYVLFLSVLRKTQLSDLGNWFVEIFLATLGAEGFEQSAIAQVAKSLGPIRFDATTNKSVLSAMNIVSQQAYGICEQVNDTRDLDPTGISLHLSHRPTSINKKTIWPDKIMAEMVMALQATGLRGH